MFHWELCKQLTFNYTDKGYKDKPESVQENKTHKIFWDFEIKMDHPILVRRCNKEEEKTRGLRCSSWSQS